MLASLIPSDFAARADKRTVTGLSNSPFSLRANWAAGSELFSAAFTRAFVVESTKTCRPRTRQERDCGENSQGDKS